MKKTHKKALGFAGLGLVAAFTAVAATIPSPSAMAVATSSITDVIQVYIPHDDAEITVNETGERKDTDPNYSFHVIYENVRDIKGIIVNRDDGDGVLYSGEFWNENLDWELGERDFSFNLNEYGGYGNYTIIVTGIGEGEVPVERILTFKYREPSGEKDTDDGEIQIDVDVPDERPASTTINIYDGSGNIVKTIDVENPGGVENIDLSDLNGGTYKIEVINKDETGRVINTTTKTLIIAKDGAGSIFNVPISDQGQELGKVTVAIKNADGETITQWDTYESPVPTSIPVDIDSLPAGNYSIAINYYDTDGAKIGSEEIPFIKSEPSGVAPVNTTTKEDTVTEVEVDIYDKNGNVVRIIKGDRATGLVSVYDENGRLLFTIPDGFKDSRKLTIPLDGLEYGDYTAVITFKNEFGRIVGNTKTLIIKYYDGGAIIVPDTGGFFQGLNISREDYLITGLIVFMVIGVVAFGVVARNRKNKVVNKKNRR